MEAALFQVEENSLKRICHWQSRSLFLESILQVPTLRLPLPVAGRQHCQWQLRVAAAQCLAHWQSVGDFPPPVRTVEKGKRANAMVLHPALQFGSVKLKA